MKSEDSQSYVVRTNSDFLPSRASHLCAPLLIRSNGTCSRDIPNNVGQVVKLSGNKGGVISTREFQDHNGALRITNTVQCLVCKLPG